MKLLTNASFFLSLLFWINCSSQVKKNLKIEFEKNLSLAHDYTNNENDSALIYIRKCKNLSVQNSFPLGLAKTKEAEAYFYESVKSDYKKATDLYLESIAICEKNKLPFLKNVYKSLGSLFHVTDNYKKAKVYYKSALDLSKKERDTLLIVKCLINLGSISSSEEKFPEAERLFLESLKYPSNFELKRATYSNLGNMKIRKKDFSEALVYLNKVIAIDPETGIGGNLVDYSYLLDAKNGAKNFDGIDTILKKSFALIQESKDLRSKSILLKSIGDVYQGTKKFEKASLIKDDYILLYDSLKAMQRDEILYEMESKYQTEKKEQLLKNQEKEKKQLFIYFLIACGFIIILGFLVYKTIKQRQILKKQKSKLEILVDEKNILIKETHHRVKNSFQIVSSLLYLQSENMQDKEAALAVKEAQNRVKSMILIHQKLYNKDQLVGINTQEYINDLVNDIIENQTATIENLTTTTEAERYILSIDTITPIGLIINEVITNVIKHAFSRNLRNPTLHVLFKKESNYLLLQISDNGIGIDTNTNENSFGIKLINALAKKLKAKISFENNNGTRFVMEIHKFEQMT